MPAGLERSLQRPLWDVLKHHLCCLQHDRQRIYCRPPGSSKGHDAAAGIRWGQTYRRWRCYMEPMEHSNLTVYVDLCLRLKYESISSFSIFSCISLNRKNDTVIHVWHDYIRLRVSFLTVGYYGFNAQAVWICRFLFAQPIFESVVLLLQINCYTTCNSTR